MRTIFRILYSTVRIDFSALPMDTQGRIRQVIETVTKKKVTAAPDESLFDAGVLDSFGLADAVAALETEFGVRVPDSDLTPRKFDSIERIEQYFADHR